MKLVQRWLQRFGIWVSRAPANRFEIIADVLVSMRERGFAPKVVVDGGANRGQFFALARPVFPDTVFHLIEPQRACIPDLDAAAVADRGDVFVHCTAITEPGVERVRMVGGGEDGGGVGNWVAKPSDDAPGEIHPDATTLDELLDGRISCEDRALLKLDLETHELPALTGASSLLQKVEAVLTEVSFYDSNDWGAPRFAEIVAFLQERRFLLYEIASLSGRARDGRLRMGDAVFVREDSVLSRDASWS